MVVDFRHRLDRGTQLHRVRAAPHRLHDASSSRAPSTIPRPMRSGARSSRSSASTGIFTSPTAVRLLMRYGEEPSRGVDHSPLERVFCAGEVLNAPAWDWLQNRISERPRAGDRPHVADRNGRSGVRQPLRHRSAADQAGVRRDPASRHRRGRRDPGWRAVRPGREGDHGIRRPFPGLTPTLWGEPERYGRDYWQTIPGRLLHRRLRARRRGRLRLVCGPRRRDHQDRGASDRHHRGRERLLKHSAVAECGVIGRPDETRGEVISAFVAAEARPPAVGGAPHASCSRRSAASSVRWRSSAS